MTTAQSLSRGPRALLALFNLQSRPALTRSSAKSHFDDEPCCCDELGLLAGISRSDSSNDPLAHFGLLAESAVAVASRIVPDGRWL